MLRVLLSRPWDKWGDMKRIKKVLGTDLLPRSPPGPFSYHEMHREPLLRERKFKCER